jgi:hypothetical protein
MDFILTKGLSNYLPRLALNGDPLDLASRVARIIGVSHQHLAKRLFLRVSFSLPVKFLSSMHRGLKLRKGTHECKREGEAGRKMSEQSEENRKYGRHLAPALGPQFPQLQNGAKGTLLLSFTHPCLQ